MTDQMRKMLDELMGANRNQDKPEEAPPSPRDRRLCRQWLCGMCPHELLLGTRASLGECPLQHDARAREEYARRVKAKDMSKLGESFDRDLLRTAGDLLAERRRRTDTQERKRLMDNKGTASNVSIAKVTRDFERTDEGKRIKERCVEAHRAHKEAVDERRQQEEVTLLQVALEEALEARAKAHAHVVCRAFKAITDADQTEKAVTTALEEEKKLEQSAVVEMDDATAALVADKLRRAEEAGEEGDVDLAEQLTTEAEELKRIALDKAKAAAVGPPGPPPTMPPPAMPPPAMPPPAMPPPAMPPPATAPPTGAAPQPLPAPSGADLASKLFPQAAALQRVCDVCCAFVSLNDNEERLADHFRGRMHLAFVRLADAKEECESRINEARGQGQSLPSTAAGAGPAPRDDRDRDRERERDHRSHDWERERWQRERYERERWERERYERERYERSRGGYYW